MAGRRGRRLAVSSDRGGLLLGLALALLAPKISASASGGTVEVRVDPARTVGVRRLATGVTHAQYSLDPWGDPAAIARAKALLKAACRYQNQHLMGWGADNPEPSPGVHNWASLDRRIALIRSMGAIPVITLCAAPDWMKGGKPGETDWSKIEVAPLPEHFGDFAALARKVAQRYPDVRYFQVWNEMKGFWKASANNWDYRAYTDLYNRVYDALKSVRRDIRVGGPYLVIEGTGSGAPGWTGEKPIRARQWEVLDYWLKHKRGADFITLDRSLIDYHDRTAYTPDQAMDLTPTFGDVARQVRSRTGLPLWWAEYYGGPGADRRYVAAQHASILAHMVKSGASVALLWQPQESGGALNAALFTDTRRVGGGQPLPLHDVMRVFHEWFGPGVRLCQATSSSKEVEVLASPGKTLLINKRDRAIDLLLNGRPLRLGPYQVRLVDTSRPPE